MSEIQATEEEKIKAVTEARMWLEENDYTAVKIVYQLAAKFLQQFPSASLTEYEKYKDREAIANEKRAIINEYTSA